MPTPNPPWLVPPAQRIPTPNRYGADKRPYLVEQVDTFFFHWTGTPHAGPTQWNGSDRPRQERWLRRAGGSSTCVDILRDGTRLMGCRLDQRAWHAGGGRVPLAHGEVLSGFNGRSIGVDLDLAGQLWPVGGGRFVDWYGWTARKAGEPFAYYKGPAPYRHPSGAYFEPFSVPAITALLQTVRELVSVFPHMRGAKRIDRKAAYGTATKLSGSVGTGGQNKFADVVLVQQWLGCEADGLVGPKTQAAIAQFQRTEVGMRNPDGRVDPGGRTERKLRKARGITGRPRCWLVGHMDVDRYKKGVKLAAKGDPGLHFPWDLVERSAAGSLSAAEVEAVDWGRIPGVGYDNAS